MIESKYAANTSNLYLTYEDHTIDPLISFTNLSQPNLVSEFLELVSSCLAQLLIHVGIQVIISLASKTTAVE